MDPTVLQILEDHLKTRMQYPNVTDLKLIYNKILTTCDVNKNQSRLAIPRKQVLTPFLTHSEDLSLKWKMANGSNNKIPLNVVVGSCEYKLSLSRWNYFDHSNTNNTTGNTNTTTTTTGNTDNNRSIKKRKRTDKKKQDDDDDVQTKMKKESYRFKYVLNGRWNQLKVENRLQSGDQIRIVSFRYHIDNIGFVLLHTPAPAN